jgi:hypothetical protein
MGTKSGQRENRGVEVEAIAQDRVRILSRNTVFVLVNKLDVRLMNG